MRILIKIFLLLLLSISSLAAQEILLEGSILKEAELPPYSNLYDVLSLSEDEWYSKGDSHQRSKDLDLWLRVSLDTKKVETRYYLTEHKGIAYWEYYLVKGDSFLKKIEVDLSFPFLNAADNSAQFRGFTYAPVTQYAGDGYVLFIHIRHQDISPYNFVLRSVKNFEGLQLLWPLLQGLGLGYLFVILLLSLVLVITLRYRINWLFVLLVLSSALNILYVTGLGPFITAQYLPVITQTIWFLLFGLFRLSVILFFQSLLKECLEGGIKSFFRFLLSLSIILVFSPVFVPSHVVTQIMILQSLVSSLLITGGLLWLTVHHSEDTRWLLTGWSLYVSISALGTIFSELDHIRSHFFVISFLLGQAVLVMFFGGAMILDIDKKRKRETDRRETAESTVRDAMVRMSEVERMADLGRMVSSVTHEMGTPLGVSVTLSTSLVSASNKIKTLYEKNELSEDDFKGFVSDVRSSSDLIFNNMEMARSLMNGFKEVASDQAEPDIRSINLNTYTDTILKVLSPGIRKSGKTIETDLEEDLNIVSIPGIMTQVITNLINNALMHGLDELPEGKIVLGGYSEKDSIVLTVRDNGKGIPEDVQDRIFDIYFTTKKGRGGTGVGLSIVRSLVEEHLKGQISFESFPSEGTVFTVVLPESIAES